MVGGLLYRRSYTGNGTWQLRNLARGGMGACLLTGVAAYSEPVSVACAAVHGPAKLPRAVGQSHLWETRLRARTVRDAAAHTQPAGAVSTV